MRAMRNRAMEAQEISREVARIVCKHIGSTYRVFLFGSRAVGYARTRSDYDFGIEGPAPIDWSALGGIKEEVEDLPTLHKIDIVDFSTVGEKFRRVADLKKIYVRSDNNDADNNAL